MALQDVDLSQKSRHQLLQLLKELQHIYVNEDIRNAVIDIVEQKVNPAEKRKIPEYQE